MNKLVFTQTGAVLYSYFIKMGGIKSTDPDFKYYLPDGTIFTEPSDVEDWIILKAKQIENERMKILISQNND